MAFLTGRRQEQARLVRVSRKESDATAGTSEAEATGPEGRLPRPARISRPRDKRAAKLSYAASRLYQVLSNNQWFLLNSLRLV